MEHGPANGRCLLLAPMEMTWVYSPCHLIGRLNFQDCSSALQSDGTFKLSVFGNPLFSG